MDIDDGRAEVVRTIFNKTVVDGYGSYRMANHLNKLNIKTNNGSKFQPNTVNRVLKNRIYCGYLSCGEIISPFNESLRTVDESTYFTAQHILKQRASREADKQHMARTTKGMTALSGNIYCGDCGHKLIQQVMSINIR